MAQLQLNSEQQQAVQHVHSPLLVLAGAGSGKTRVISEKIAYLVRQNFVQAKAIYAVTFTNKAAREMQQRVYKTLHKNEAKGIVIATFHTLGRSILKKHGSHYGLKKNFSIYDEEDSLKLIIELSGQERDTAQIILQKISRWKNEGCWTDAIPTAGDEFTQLAATTYTAYQAQLRAYNAVDFDDLIALPLQIFQQYPAALSEWRTKIGYLLVDEYQDTNHTQYQLIKLLLGHRHTLTVVGDDDQSIYAWRGAQPQNISRLHEELPQLHIIKLEQNYRSSQTILRAANQVIRQNPHLFVKQLWSTLEEGERLLIKECRDPEEEADVIAHSIYQAYTLQHYPLSECAILYRSNHQARLLELALRRYQLPYRLIGGSSFFQQPEIKDLLAYLRIIANPNDSAALLRIINIPPREIGAMSIKKITEFAHLHHLSLLEAIQHEYLHHVIGRPLHYKLQQLAVLLKDIQEQASKDILTAFEQLVTRIEYQNYLKTQYQSKQTVERKWQQCQNLGEWVASQSESLAESLNQLALIALLENKDSEENEACITLMTLHSAKGLEFPHVFLIGMEEDILPHRNSIDDDNVEEERRLFYVGLTRAQKTLQLSYCQQRKRYGEWERCLPSRFLEELPPEDIVWHKKGQVLAPETKAHNAKQALAAIKASLQQKQHS